MMSVKQISELTGISVRTLHYYDEIGLLRPSTVGENGYRYYDDTALERLQQILLFRELEFSLKEIGEIIDSHDFDRNEALNRQIELLTRKKEHLENVILFAKGIKLLGVRYMDFSVFDLNKLDEYAENAKKRYGSTEAYREFEQRESARTKEEDALLAKRFMTIFARLGTMRDKPCESAEVQKVIAEIQSFITDNLYNCTDKILLGLGKMYAGGGEITENIDKAGGEGTAELAARAIEYYVENKR